MRFVTDVDNDEPVSACFRQALANTIAKGFRHIPLLSERHDILATSFSAELYEVLGGSIPFSGRNGPVYVVLSLTTGSLRLANICGGGVETRIVADHTFFDEAQVDLLFHIVDILDSRFVYLGWKQGCVMDAISTIALGICRILDGSAIIQTPDGEIRPSLAFSRMPSGREAITYGKVSWMQQYVAGVVPKHFSNIHQSFG